MSLPSKLIGISLIILGATTPAAQPASSDDFIRRFNAGAVSDYERQDFLRLSADEQAKIRTFLLDSYRQLADRSKRLDSLRVLALWRDSSVVPLALDAMQSNDDLLQKHGAGACWQLAEKACLPSLRRLLASGKYPPGDHSTEVMHRIVRDIEAGWPYRDIAR